MKNDNIFDIANSELDEFLDKNILKYSQLRNFDFGVNKRDNISHLSKFISHRILFEYDLVKKVINKHSFIKVEKFIQEIFWRIYWKSHLEYKPSIWFDFINYDFASQESPTYFKAINSQTGIKCFDDWARELKDFNYLHNHSRMWFASIWIFTLNLPWQLGAKFFLSHLLDGDAAVNILSWRWVAGLHTKGKHYLAKSWNINKFTNKRFSNLKLNEQAEPKVEVKNHYITNITYKFLNKKNNKFLIMFENDCYFLNKENLYSKYQRIFIIKAQNSYRIIKLSKNVINYKNNLLLSLNQNLKNSVILTRTNFIQKSQIIKNFDVAYPFIGENLDFINDLVIKQELKVTFLHRYEDIYCLDYARKGFFNFKNNIPKIIKNCCYD